MFLSLGACTKDSNQSSPRSEIRSPSSQNSSEAKSKQSANTTPHETKTTAPGVCLNIPDGLDKAPFLIKGSTAFATRFSKLCEASGGKPGFSSNSSWTAMGLPCAGGGGKVEWKGLYHNPKILVFDFGTTCPMQPMQGTELQVLMHQLYRMDPSAPLVSYVPMAVQFWDIPEHGESGTGDQIEIKNLAVVQKIWTKFRAMQGFDLVLYGRENAWGAGSDVYRYDVTLSPMGKSQYRVDAKQVRILKEDELQALQKRCLESSFKKECNTLMD